MMRFQISLGLILLCSSVNARSEELKTVAPVLTETSVVAEPPVVAPSTTEKIAIAASNTMERRALAKGFVLINYSPLDLLIPSKYGLTLGLIRTVDQSFEFEYLHGSLSAPFILKDLGSMVDDRYSLIIRSYHGQSSFNFSYGLSYFDFSMHLGDKILNKVTPGNYDSIDLARLQAVGFNLGVGNRWTFAHNITLGIDWISWAQPVFTTKRQSSFLDSSGNQSDRDDVNKVLGFVSNFPRFAALKVQLGILF